MSDTATAQASVSSLSPEHAMREALCEFFARRHRSLRDARLNSWDALCCELMQNETNRPSLSIGPRREIDYVEFHLRFDGSDAEGPRCLRFESRLECDTDEVRCYGRPMRVVHFEIACPPAWLSNPDATCELLDSVWNGGRLLLITGDPNICARHLPRLVLRYARCERGRVSLRCNFLWCARVGCQETQTR